MKTQIIRLDSHDDVLSARDKMGWSQTGRILLVWPDSGRVMNRRLDLILLQRHSHALGAQLALITRDQDVRYHARQLAIPIYKTLRHAQDAHWRPERRQRPRQRTFIPRAPQPLPDYRQLRAEIFPIDPMWLSHPAARIVFFTLGVFAILALGAVLLPGARIGLAPHTQHQRISLIVKADPDLTSINLSGAVPARQISTIVEGQRSMQTQGMIRVPEAYASGRVFFKNLTDQEIDIPAGLVVRTIGTQPVRFSITLAGHVPAGPGTTITLPVRALLPGPKGNLPADSLVAIEGNLGLMLAASNPMPTNGGTDQPASAPTQYNRQRLYDLLESDLRTTALEDLKAQLSAEDVLLPASITLTHVIEQTYNPPTLQPADQLTLSLQVEYQVEYASADDLNALAEGVLNANLPSGYQPAADSLRIQNTTVADSNLSWSLQADRDLEAQIASPQAVSLVLGQPLDRAASVLTQKLLLNGSPTITIWPSWWPRLPILPFRISIINYAYPGN